MGHSLTHNHLHRSFKMNELSLSNQTYAVTVASKKYPEPKPGLTPYFESIVRDLTGVLSLKVAKAREMYPEFGKRVQLFNRTFEEIKAFLWMIRRSNCVGGDWNEIFAQLGLLKKKLDGITFCPPPGLTAEVAILPEDQQLALLNKGIVNNVRALVHFITSALDELVNEEQVGLFESFGKRVCRFHFYVNSFETEDTILGRKHTQEGRKHTEEWTRETTKTERRQRHQHDLVDADEWMVGKDKPPVPHRVEWLVDGIPELFKPFFRIVTGSQIFEHVIEEVQKTTTQNNETRTWVDPLPPTPPMSVWRWDPALTFGHYVVAGWDDTEVSEARSVEERLSILALELRIPRSRERRTMVDLMFRGDSRNSWMQFAEHLGRYISDSQLRHLFHESVRK